MANTKKEQENPEIKVNNWGKFGVSLLTSFITIAIFALIGSNYLYIQNYISDGKRFLGNLFPDKAEYTPYQNMANPMSGGDPTNIQSKINIFNKVTGLNYYSFPYTLKSSEPGILGNIKKWIANSIEFSYINGRMGLNKMIDFSKAAEGAIGSTGVLLLIVPIITILISLVPLYGFISNFIGQFLAPNNGWIYAIIFFFVLGIDFFIASGVSIVQTLQYIATFAFLPVFIDAAGVGKIVSNHSLLFAGLYGIFVVSNAFATLQTPLAVTMLLTYLVLMIMQVFF